MSITCRRVKAQGVDKEYYWVRNSGVSPTAVDLSDENPHECEHLIEMETKA